MKQEILNITIQSQDGIFELTQLGTKVVHKDVEYTYCGTGESRRVYANTEKTKVIKVPHNRVGVMHNQIEAQVYQEAPDWCKPRIVPTELLDGYIFQDYVEVRYGDNWLREYGINSNGEAVIFDTDIFCKDLVYRPKGGFYYQKVFSSYRMFGEAHKRAIEIPKELNRIQRAKIAEYFPNFDDSLWASGSGSNKETVVTYNGKVVPREVCIECGFINPDYE